MAKTKRSFTSRLSDPDWIKKWLEVISVIGSIILRVVHFFTSK